MKNLPDLKQRLEDLPEKRKRRQHEGRYKAFLEKASAAKKKLTDSSAGIALTELMVPAAVYNGARASIKSCSVTSVRLRGKLLKETKESNIIAEPDTEQGFVSLSEKAASALEACQRAWESELQAKVKDWETIQEVVAKLMPAQGARLKRAIASLHAAKRALPLTKKAADDIKDDLEDLKDAIAKLDLKGTFGEFLRATVSPDGADLSLAQDAEVSKVISKHKLQHVFRVRVSS